jgi:transcriptional regulator with XRE-family HTH domain
MELKMLRKRLGVKLEVVSTLSAVSEGTISRALNGKREPRPEVLAKIEKTLNDISRVRSGFADVAIDMDDVAWLRKKIRELEQVQQP